jgi:hypothetical protein
MHQVHSYYNLSLILWMWGKAMANYPQELAQDAVCQSHTGRMTGLWLLPARPLRLNTNEWMNDYECGVYYKQIGRYILHCHNLSWMKQYWADIIFNLEMWNFRQHFIVLNCCYVTLQTNVHTKLTETDVKESIWSTWGPCWAETIILLVPCHICKHICRWCESITLHSTSSVYLMQEPATARGISMHHLQNYILKYA